MKKILFALALTITAKASFAISIADMPGYTNDISVLASTATLTGAFTQNPGSVSASAKLTDNLASSWAFSNSDTAYVDLTFGTNIYDQSGTDLSIFFVGAGGHSVSISLFSSTASTKAKTFSAISYTGYCVDNDSNGICGGALDDPIYVMNIDLGIFHLFGPVESIRLDVSKGSSVPSLIGAYYATAAPPTTAIPAVPSVPLPLPLYLFSSGLALLLGFTRRKVQAPRD